MQKRTKSMNQVYLVTDSPLLLFSASFLIDLVKSLASSSISAAMALRDTFRFLLRELGISEYCALPEKPGRMLLLLRLLC